MPKKIIDGEPLFGRPPAGENAPPLLSEKLIAQLQGAVQAAQRRRGTPQSYATHSKDDSPPNE
jgi:hypothetical protein